MTRIDNQCDRITKHSGMCDWCPEESDCSANSVVLSKVDDAITEFEMSNAIRLFGITKEFRFGGWIIPTGDILDFNKRYDKNKVRGWRKNCTGPLIYHCEIGNCFCKDRIEKARCIDAIKSEEEYLSVLGIDGWTVTQLAVKIGLVRFGTTKNGLYFDIPTNPTSQQIDVLYDIESYRRWCFSQPENYCFTIGEENKIYSCFEDFRKHFVSDVKSLTQGRS